MKLKAGFVTHEIAGEQIMVATGSANFSGLVRSNETAAFIINCLKTDTNRTEIIAAMMKEYDASEAQVAASVDSVIGKLRGIGALDE